VCRIEQQLLPPEPYDAGMVKEKHTNQPDGGTLAELTKETNRPRTTASVRKAQELSAAATRPVHPNECVYNRETKEYGLIRQVHEKNGLVMYEVRIPAIPDSLKWGFFVSDWAEAALEPSDKKFVRW
jgi:hypothetical protein